MSDEAIPNLNMKPTERIKPTKQVYSNYTTEDFAVWKTLFNRQMDLLAAHGCKDYLKAVNDIKFNENEIPNFENTNAILKSVTGWQLKTVPCLCPPNEFFELLSFKTFTATCWLRKMSELDYIEEPDMFHDVFGHAPLLTNPDYTAFFQALGKLAKQHHGNQRAIDMIERLYWFTIEFGLTYEDGKVKIYGAGIISSKGELQNALSHKPVLRNFDVREVMNHNFRNDVIQNEYYVIQGYSQLKSSLREIEEILSEE